MKLSIKSICCKRIILQIYMFICVSIPKQFLQWWCQWQSECCFNTVKLLLLWCRPGNRFWEFRFSKFLPVQETCTSFLYKFLDCVSPALMQDSIHHVSTGTVEVSDSDDSISVFQFWHDIDTILTKYRDIDAISIFCKCVRYTSSRTVTRHEHGSMLYLDNNVCLSDS